MKALLFYFLLWAGLGTALYFTLDHFRLPLWWLVVYGFATMAAFLIYAATRPSNLNRR